MAKAMTVAQVMKFLEERGDEKAKARYVRDGAGENVFGVLMGAIRGLANSIGTNHALGMELWATGNHDARLVACMVLDPAVLTEKDAQALLKSVSMPYLVDELVGRALVESPVAERLAPKWMDSKEEFTRRAGWKILAGRIGRGVAKELDVPATLARIEREFAAAPYRVKEGINYCLVWIGLHLPEHTKAVLALGERLGRWDPRPIPKGCTSTYAPDWIAAATALKNGQKTEARKAMEAKAASSGARVGEKKKSAVKKASARARAR